MVQLSKGAPLEKQFSGPQGVPTAGTERIELRLSTGGRAAGHIIPKGSRARPPGKGVAATSHSIEGFCMQDPGQGLLGECLALQPMDPAGLQSPQGKSNCTGWKTMPPTTTRSWITAP